MRHARRVLFPVISSVSLATKSFFGEAPYFCLVRTSTPGKGILDIQFLPNPYTHEEKRKGIKVSEWLVENGVDRIYTRKPFEGKGPSYVFASAEVEVRVTDARAIEEVLPGLPITGLPL